MGGGSRTAATSKMQLFVVIVNGLQPLTIITKCSIFDVAAVLDPPLNMGFVYCIFPYKYRILDSVFIREIQVTENVYSRIF